MKKIICWLFGHKFTVNPKYNYVHPKCIRCGDELKNKRITAVFYCGKCYGLWLKNNN